MDVLTFAAGLHISPSEGGPRRPDSARTHRDKQSTAEIDTIELVDSTSRRNPDEVTRLPPIPETTTKEATSNVEQVGDIPVDLEASEPSTPQGDDAVGIMPSWSYPKMNKWRVLAGCAEYLGNGMNDSAPGALIPYIEAWYHIDYATVSTIWIGNAAGFIVAAFFTDLISGRLGRAKSQMLSECVMILAYTIIACTPPFPAVAVAYFILGFGAALNLALNNVFCANLANSTVILGATHGSYGIGGTIAPIIATLLVSNGIHWARFFLITLGVRLLCLFFVGWAFWNYEREGVNQFANSLQKFATRQSEGQAQKIGKLRSLGIALRHRTTIVGALLIFAYQGAEVSESGWFISYLINYRNAIPAHVGYVTSGFWGGITIGRFVLVHAAPRIGEKRFIFVLGVGVMAFQLMAWFIPNVIGDAVAVAIIGLLLGPIFPCASTAFTRLLPGNMQVTAMSFISSAGSSGGAVVPFMIGLIAQKVGTFVLHPICMVAYVVMVVSVVVLPRTPKRAE